MTEDELEAEFEAHDDEYLQFDRVSSKRSARPDLHAFILLHELVPGARDIIAAAEHDEIFLDVEPEDLARAASKDQIIELIRCGVHLSNESLAMFV